MPLLSIILSIALYATTNHAQDFKDEDGDRALGRSTIPLAVPKVARMSIFVGLAFWSIILSVVWELNLLYAVCFIALGVLIGGRYLKYEGMHQDQVSYYWYNVSILPLQSVMVFSAD